jgi:hypothetical protein
MFPCLSLLRPGTAPLLAAAQGGMYCMTGVPCGNGCTMGDGLCINGRCFDHTGQVEWECMAPMRAPGSFAPFRLNGHDSQPSWMQPQQQQQAPAQPRQQQQQAQQDADFNPWMQQQQMPRFAPLWQPWGFPSFWRPMSWFGSPFATPFAPMGPLFNNDCGGKGPCAKGQFCDAQGVCRADDCVSQFKYGCPDDKGELKKVSSWGAAAGRLQQLSQPAHATQPHLLPGAIQQQRKLRSPAHPACSTCLLTVLPRPSPCLPVCCCTPFHTDRLPPLQWVQGVLHFNF